MLIAIIAVFIGLLLLTKAVGGFALMIVRECGAIQSAIKNQGEQVTAVRDEILAELEFVRSQLADYIGNELLEKRVLPAVGYRETPDIRQEIARAIVTADPEFFTE
jgi:hypothetical protein